MNHGVFWTPERISGNAGPPGIGAQIRPGGSTLQASVVIVSARPSCFILFVHWARRAASRAAWTAGRSRRNQYADHGDDDQELDQGECPCR